ncbi:hypothetical protein VNI00_011396 [Paramarasmius palmivorus]|uniref:Uncharacterized protein n=1 Tax=Paramarasmius palmivorus TaxID=297713 RepID=A0AAW0CCC7_9AGAR
MSGWNQNLCRGKINAANLIRQDRSYIEDYAKRYDISQELSSEEIVSQIFSDGKEWIPILDMHSWAGDEDKMDITARKVPRNRNHERFLAPHRPKPNARHSPLPREFPDPPEDTYTPSPSPEPALRGRGSPGFGPTSAEGASPRPQIYFAYPPEHGLPERDANDRDRPREKCLEELFIDHEADRESLSHATDELFRLAEKASLEVVGLMGDIKAERKDMQILVSAIEKICGREVREKITADTKATVAARQPVAAERSDDAQTGDVRIPVDGRNKAILGRNPLVRLPRHPNRTINGSNAASSSMEAGAGPIGENSSAAAVIASRGPKPNVNPPTRKRAASDGGMTTRRINTRLASSRAQQEEMMKRLAKRPLRPLDGPANKDGTTKPEASKRNTRNKGDAGIPPPKPSDNDRGGDHDDHNGDPKPNGGGGAIPAALPTQSKGLKRNIEQVDEDDNHRHAESERTRPDRPSNKRAKRGGTVSQTHNRKTPQPRAQNAPSGSHQPSNLGAQPSSSRPSTSQPNDNNVSTSNAPPPSRPRPLTRQYNIFFPLLESQESQSSQQTPPPPPTPLPQGAPTPTVTPQPSPPPAPSSPPLLGQEEEGGKGHSVFLGMAEPPSDWEPDSDEDSVMADDGNSDGAEEDEEKRRERRQKRFSALHNGLVQNGLKFVDVGDKLGRLAVFKLPPKEKSPESDSDVGAPVAGPSSRPQPVNPVAGPSTSPDSNSDAEPQELPTRRSFWFDPPPVPRGRALRRQTERVMVDPLTQRLIAYDWTLENRNREVARTAREAETRDNLRQIREAVVNAPPNPVIVVQDESEFMDEDVELTNVVGWDGSMLF